MPDYILLGCDAMWCGSIGMLWHVVWQHCPCVCHAPSFSLQLTLLPWT